MFTLHSKYRRGRHAFAALVLAATSASTIVQAGPHAVTPVPVPHFSLEPSSPSIGRNTPTGIITAASVLDRGSSGPTVVISPANLGLQTTDAIHSLSANRSQDVPTGATFVLLFGVDRISAGAVPPDSSLTNRPFNVQDQANRHQQACDAYMTLDGWTRSGGPITQGLRVPPYQNNTLVVNQGDAGGSDFATSPNVPPETTLPPGTPQDEGDGTYYGSTVVASGIFVPKLYFTVSRQSSVPTGIPGISASGANIYVDGDLSSPGGQQVYASAGQLGLQGGVNGDEIDSLVVFDTNSDGIFNLGDQVLFSLARNSPSLNGRSPADLFTIDGPCTAPCCSCNSFAHAVDLGLAQTDNVDALELLVTNDVRTTVFNSAIYFVLPGDYDGDGALTANDCNNFANCCSGPGVPASAACMMYDMDSDGDVDGQDLMIYKMLFSQYSGGQVCLPLSVSNFINVLLTKSPGSAACMADLNADGHADGKDIQLYIRMLLGP